MNRDPIQVAEYVPTTGNVGLVHPLHGGRWTRAGVVEYVQQTVNAINDGPVLIGFDFAFAYPYCDKTPGTYFPGAVAPPQTPWALWSAVEEWCNGIEGADNFYGAPLFRNENSPYREFYRYQYFEGNNFEPRSRITEDTAEKVAGQRPNSVFNCLGPADVGTGSVAGMRVLHEFVARVQSGTMKPITIWPFNSNGVPAQSTVVEIYPRLFLNRAEKADIDRVAENVNALCEHFGAKLQNPPEVATDDQRDALVSAAGMGWLIQQGLIAWRVPPCAAEYEGWIFGAPSP